jgi:uncharacterized membrane protein
MEIAFKIFLVLHILGGSIGLFTGTFNIVLKKGDKRHKFVGLIFTVSMLIAGFSSFGLSILHPNFFLFMVGIFTIYQVATGYRYLHLKMLGTGQKPTILDWTLTIGMLIAGILFILFGTIQFFEHNNFGIVYFAFGTLGLLAVKTDFNNYNGKSKVKNYWLLAHFQRMTGGYTAALTAFLVVNLKYMPEIVPSIIVWLLPSLIFTSIILLWTKKYRVYIK